MLSVKDEMRSIVAMSQPYLQEDKLKELLIKWDEEIGKKSENDLTKQFLSLLRTTIDKPLPPAPLWMWPAFYLLVIAHIFLVIGVFASFFTVPFLANWYVSLPIMTFIWFFSTTKVECQLTNLENNIRRRLGMKRIGGFVGHYFLRPMKLLLLSQKRRLRAARGN